MAQLGMDADAVEHLGHQLRDQIAPQISDLINAINGVVGNMEKSWWGPDAQAFCHQWWPQHQKELHNAFLAIQGLGQAALNNAHDQRAVSSS
jgi:uncharacterized protein YukE